VSAHLLEVRAHLLADSLEKGASSPASQRMHYMPTLKQLRERANVVVNGLVVGAVALSSRCAVLGIHAGQRRAVGAAAGR